MKKLYLILILLAGLHFSSFSQARSSVDATQQSHILKYYPNPAYSNINFEFERNYNNAYALVIFNFIGKKVFELQNLPSRLNVPLDEFFRGIYIFQLRDKNGTIVESGKFQVVK